MRCEQFKERILYSWSRRYICISTLVYAAGRAVALARPNLAAVLGEAAVMNTGQEICKRSATYRMEYERREHGGEQAYLWTRKSVMRYDSTKREQHGNHARR